MRTSLTVSRGLMPATAMYVLPTVLIFSILLNLGLSRSCRSFLDGRMTTKCLLIPHIVSYKRDFMNEMGINAFSGVLHHFHTLSKLTMISLSSRRHSNFLCTSASAQNSSKLGILANMTQAFV